MADLFISYAHEDRGTAQKLARALTDQGWSVFWDRTIPPSKTWRSHIGQALEDATCVIVLWSAASIDSDFVCEEADDAKRRDALLPVFIESVRPPLGFRAIQAAGLIDWGGDAGAESFLELRDAVDAVVAESRRREEEEKDREEREAEARRIEKQQQKQKEAEQERLRKTSEKVEAAKQRQEQEAKARRLEEEEQQKKAEAKQERKRKENERVAARSEKEGQEKEAEARRIEEQQKKAEAEQERTRRAREEAGMGLRGEGLVHPIKTDAATKQKPKPIVIAVVVVVVVAGLFAILTFIASIKSPVQGELATMPELTRKSERDASRILGAKGYSFRVENEFSASIEPGIVMRHNPAAGAAFDPSRETIRLVITESQLVPAVVGQPLPDAKKLLAQHGLEPGRIEERPVEAGRAGQIMAQNPTAERRVRAGTAVDLVVGVERAAPEPAIMPALTRKSEQDASRILGAKGYAFTVENEFSALMEPGIVKRHTPAAGAIFDPSRETIRLVVAESQLVPAVVGRPLTAAKKLLVRHGLEAGPDRRTVGKS